MDEYVRYRVRDGVADVEFFHEKSNCFPTTLLDRFVDVINELSINNQVKVISIRSKGNRVFSAGASFDELLNIEDLETGKKFFSGFARVILAMKNCPKIIIGCVVGKVVGGGVGLVAACDYAIADESAFIRLSELSIGIGPFVIEPVVSRKIGLNAFAEMSLTPTKWRDAFWAKEKGLFGEVVGTERHCIEKVEEMATQLATYNMEALGKLKNILWKDIQNWETLLDERAAMSGQLVLSDFTKETLNKFKNKN